MNNQAGELAARFQQVNDEVIRTAQECTADHWRRVIPHEGRSIAYLIDHIAWAYAVETKAMQAAVTGIEPARAEDEMPSVFTRDTLDARNAERWAANPYPGQIETIARLRLEGEQTVAVLRHLDAAELRRKIRYGWRSEMSLVDFAEKLLIGHPAMHLPGIRGELTIEPENPVLSVKG